MKKKVLLAILWIPVVLFSQVPQKKPLDHTVYDSWKELQNQKISDNGKWVAYEINPQKGDGWLYVYDIENKKMDSLFRGYQADFTPDDHFLVAKIKPLTETVRAAKKKKVKDDEMPKDSLVVWNLATHEKIFFGRIASFNVPEKGTSLVVFKHEKPVHEKDTTLIDDEKEKKEKQAKVDGTQFTVYFPKDKIAKEFPLITEYALSERGNLLTFIEVPKDTLARAIVHVFDTEKKEDQVIFENKGHAQKIVAAKDNKQAVFLHAEDTTHRKIYSLYYWNSSLTKAEFKVDTLTQGMPEGWGVSEHGKIFFSEDGTKVFFGTAEKPKPEPKDSLLDEEKARLDVWNWKDPLLQPMQKQQAEKEKKRSFLAVYHLKNNTFIQLGDREIIETKVINKGNTEVIFGTNPQPYQKYISWVPDDFSDFYKIDVNTGKKTLLLTKSHAEHFPSPDGKYVAWYEPADSNWYAMNVNTGIKKNLTANLNAPFYDELMDMPMHSIPHGMAGWMKKGEALWVYDRYDIWKLDPEGKIAPVNLTKGYGRKHTITFRYVTLDPEKEYIDPADDIYLSAFHQKDKQSGYFLLHTKQKSEPEKLLFGPYKYEQLGKAKDQPLFLWRKGNFEDYPELHITGPSFQKPIRISYTNPQQKEYLWGTTELLSWYSFDNKELQGILVKPENFDPGKKYPMLVYFYEISSDRIYSHSIPSPSRSIINWPYCASNGYLVFVPDIVYTTGYPGQSAYDAIVSGVKSLMERFDFIDKDRIGLQGQSWGGYQTAFLVTRTNMFRAAMAGAPVSNMTSAYGGIRWGSGMSRMFQYEQTQSRIGGTLWEKPIHYIENSPLFFVPKINTPLLMMHNDADGAVPWYQGIEFFVALRRLNKPVWMLVYNEEEHNLTKYPNRKDLSIRMMQFFEHYLKNAPVPEWMDKGIPAIEKGINDGYGFIK